MFHDPLNISKIIIYFFLEIRELTMQSFWQKLVSLWKDEGFLHAVEQIETILAKVLSLGMIVVIIIATLDLIRVVAFDLFSGSELLISRLLFEIFGMFLNVLVALEILQNITAYLRKHVIQVELVIVTSLVAIARKIIILDLDKTSGTSIIGLGVGIFALSISYWIIRVSNQDNSKDQWLSPPIGSRGNSWIAPTIDKIVKFLEIPLDR